MKYIYKITSLFTIYIALDGVDLCFLKITKYGGVKYFNYIESYSLFDITLLPFVQLSISILGVSMGWVLNETETGLEFKIKIGNFL